MSSIVIAAFGFCFGFRSSNFCRARSLAMRPTPILENQVTVFKPPPATQ
jgi:hypothetical protein